MGRNIAIAILKTGSCGWRLALGLIQLRYGIEPLDIPDAVCANSSWAAVGCRLGLPRSAPYFAVQPQKGRSRRVVLQSTKCGADVSDPTPQATRLSCTKYSVVKERSGGRRRDQTFQSRHHHTTRIGAGYTLVLIKM